jgi:hypothetical protein
MGFIAADERNENLGKDKEGDAQPPDPPLRLITRWISPSP